MSATYQVPILISCMILWSLVLLFLRSCTHCGVNYIYIYNSFSGNVEKNEAESMVKHIEDVLFNDPKPISRPIFPSQTMASRVVELGTRIKCFYHQEGSNPSDENSALVHYIQV